MQYDPTSPMQRVRSDGGGAGWRSRYQDGELGQDWPSIGPKIAILLILNHGGWYLGPRTGFEATQRLYKAAKSPSSTIGTAEIQW